MMNHHEFEQWLKQTYPHVSNDQLNQFETFSNLINEYNQAINLVSRTEDTNLYEKHFVDSLLFKIIEQTKDAKNIDLGAGAGFPSIPLKIMYPNMSLCLLEATKKRCDFLAIVKEKLNLDQINIINDRAEFYVHEGREQFDNLFARAVASLNILLELAAPLIKVGGYIYAYKGSNGQQEVNQAQDALSQLGLKVEQIIIEQLPILKHPRSLIIIKKTAQTPLKYPRMYSQIKKRPL